MFILDKKYFVPLKSAPRKLLSDAGDVMKGRMLQEKERVGEASGFKFIDNF